MDLNKIFNNSNPKDIKKLIALLQAMVDVSEPSDDDSSDIDSEPQPKIKTRSRKVNSKNNQSKQDHNKFLEMQELHMHKEDTAFQKKVSVHPPVPRNRGYEPIKARCRVCGTEEMVNPAIVESIDRYKCNKCASSAG